MDKRIRLVTALLLISAWAPACAENIDQITLPEGFSIEPYAQDVTGARQMVLGDDGTLFVGSRSPGKVYAVLDDDGDQRADRVLLVVGGMEMPSGLAFRDGTLYIADINKIYRLDNIESRLENPPEPVLIRSDLPLGHHNWKYLRFGPDGWLYLAVGVPCNVCLQEGYGQIRRVNLETGEMEVFAKGVRNSVGLAFHPGSGELWFTDNGRDRMGDDIPSCELNHAPRPGMHFGFPFCHAGDVPDPQFGQARDCAEFEPPAVKLGPHVAPLGLTFYTGDMFPPEYRNQLFIAEHGSWNRSSKIGYRVKLVTFGESGLATGQRVFAEGWLQGERNWGRPVDVFQMPDGALLVSDDQGGKIFRISYTAAER
ncbi:MAG: sorbosone dehydrogenase family protein [Xanthomonadales bacterium]|nr:sorbosone dehydrogenase family protein [Xanthomonadales bacterium]